MKKIGAIAVLILIGILIAHLPEKAVLENSIKSTNAIELTNGIESINSIKITNSIETTNSIAAKAMDGAKKCITEPARLKRLACFDLLFGTSLTVSKLENAHFFMPQIWQRAIDNEAQRSEEKGFSVHQVDEDDPSAGIWMTISALPRASLGTSSTRLQGDGVIYKRPILILSCIDNISRVELALPKANLALKASVTNDNRKRVTHDWLMDEQGWVFRTGRGLVAIEVMKSFISSSTTKLRSDVEAINGLQFDTEDLHRAITPLREACRW